MPGGFGGIMIKLKLIVLGQLTEAHWRAACDEYKKRLSHTCNVQEIELKEVRMGRDPAQGEITAALEREADQILAQIPPRAFTVALCVEGKQYTSPALSALIDEKITAGASELCFIIGSSHGLSERVKQAANLRFSMSALTFPHQLARVMLYECIYRCTEIRRGSPYHK